MYDRKTLVISLEDMEPTTFDSLRKAAKAIDVTYGTLRYAKDKERNFVKKAEIIYETLKMPHSNFKERSYTLNTGVGKCSCGQTFDFMSEKDMNMKLRMHHKFCSKPPKSSKQIRKPSWIDITTSEHNQEATLHLQELTSALLIQRLFQVHLLGST